MKSRGPLTPKSRTRPSSPKNRYRQRAPAIAGRRSGFGKRLRNGLTLAWRAAAITTATGALLACCVAAYRAFEGNGFLMLKKIEVTGNRAWDRSQILEKAGLELGVKLPGAPVARAEMALKNLPGISDAKVERVFPSGVRIRVTEKFPVAMGYAGGWHGLAADGSRIPGLARENSDLPVLEGFAALDSLTLSRLGGFLESVKSGYPSLYAGFSQISVLNGDDVEVFLRDGRLKAILSMGDKSLNSLEFLQTLIRRKSADLEAGKTVDLRVEGYAYVR